MIGGVIILSLLLTALGAMVFVSQQNDQYQQSVNKMAQYDSQRLSENLVFNFPGLTFLTSSTVPGWGICSSTTYNYCYNMTVSNLGGVGVQIVRIYINSTGSGCTSLCVLNPTLAPTLSSYAFNQANQFINAGETNHAVLLYLRNVILPSSSFSKNTVLIVTSRGNVFSFQWPFQSVVGGQSQSAFSAGILKIAYQYSQAYPACATTNPPLCYDSQNEPGLGGSGGTNYCHNEPARAYPAGSSYAEKLTGMSSVGVGDGGVLWFVSPWVTQAIFNSAQTNGVAPSGHSGWPSNLTTLYLYVNITNVGSTPFAINGGSIDLTWYSYNWVTANLIGFYEGAAPGTFYPAGSTHTVAAHESFYGIFKVTEVSLGTASSTNTWPPPAGESVMFLGSASLTSSTQDETFIAGVALMSGLWIRNSCS
jgi:hypothetical protein